MRKEKDKDNTRIPKPVPGSNGKRERQKTSNSRSLRSNSSGGSNTRPIRINRDCLKGIPATPKRVDKRTRPFIQKSKKGSDATPQASATKVPASPEVKPRAPEPRVTPHCCIKPAVSKNSTKSTRVLRSHVVPKATSSIQSSKTGTVAKLSTTSTGTQTSNRAPRTPVVSTRNAVTTNQKSNIPKFTWNLRSRSSISKPECKTSKRDEAKPLRKRRAEKDSEGTTVKRLTIARDGKQSKVVKTEEKKAKCLLVKKPPQQQKKVDLNKGQTSSDDLKLSKPSFEKIEIQILAVSQETSLADRAHEAPASQLKEEQAELKDSAQELETKTILAKVEIKATNALREEPLSENGDIDAGKIPSIEKISSAIEPITKSPVPKKNLEERPLTPVNSETRSLGEDATVDVFEVAATPTTEEGTKSFVKSSEVTTTPLAKKLDISVDTSISGKDQPSCDEKPVSSVQVEMPSAASNVLQETLTASVKPATPVSHIETAKLEAKLCTAKAEIAPVLKQKADIVVCNATRAVEPRLENEITSKTPEVNSQSSRDKPSIIGAEIVPLRTPTLAEAIGQLHEIKAKEPLLVEPPTVLKEQLNPVTASACFEPNTKNSRIQLPNALNIQAWKEKPSFTGFKTSTFSETLLLGTSQSRKRRGATPPIEDIVLTKKWRSSSPANVQPNSRTLSFPEQSCSTQFMDIGGLTPAVSSLNMEVDSSSTLPFAFNLTFNRFPSVFNTQNVPEDMELCDSGSSLTLTSNQQSLGPLFGCQPFAHLFASSSQATGHSSFSFNQPTSQQFSFGNSFSQTGIQAKQTVFSNVPQAPPLPFGGFNQTGNHVFGNQTPSAMSSIPKAPPLPVSGFGNISNQRFTFGCSPPQANQSSSVFGATNASILKVRPMLFKSDRPPREFIFSKGQRRRNVVKPWFNLNQTTTQPQVLSFQPNSRQVFGGFGIMQSPTPMESDDIPNPGGNTLFGGLSNQPANLFGKSCGQVTLGSLQPTPGQKLNDHAMGDILEIPSLGSGMLPHRSTASCFAMSCQTMQTKLSPQRTFSLPQLLVTAGIPASPLIKPARFQLPSVAGEGFTKNVSHPWVISSENPTNVSCATSTTRATVSRQPTQPNLEEREESTTLHKIYSSVSSLCSTSSNLSDCQSEIDALIETLSDSISNCSLEDKPELNDVGKLVVRFETLSIAD